MYADIKSIVLFSQYYLYVFYVDISLANHMVRTDYMIMKDLEQEAVV
jgi:hypothetical protein